MKGKSDEEYPAEVTEFRGEVRDELYRLRMKSEVTLEVGNYEEKPRL